MKTITLLALMAFTTLACAHDDDCDEYYSYEYRAEVGIFQFYEVDICHDGLDVNQDDNFDTYDMSWMIGRLRHWDTVPHREDAVGDLNGDGVVSAGDFCELYDELIDEGIINPLGDDCPITFPTKDNVEAYWGL